jgi:hypothetical protein
MGSETASLIGTIETTVKAYTEDGVELGTLPVSVPVYGWAPIYLETWELAGRRIAVESDANKTCMVSLDLFRRVLSDLGFQKVDE